MTPIRWTSQALEDIAGIRDLIARDASGYAEVVVDRIFESVDRLHEFPLSGRIVTVYHSARLPGPSDLPAV